jgi:hypothetical protein
MLLELDSMLLYFGFGGVFIPSIFGMNIVHSFVCMSKYSMEFKKFLPENPPTAYNLKIINKLLV